MEVINDIPVETKPIKKRCYNTPEYNRQYYLKRKEALMIGDQFDCPCGYTGSVTHKSRHQKTKNHKIKMLEIANNKLKEILYKKVIDLT